MPVPIDTNYIGSPAWNASLGASLGNAWAPPPGQIPAPAPTAEEQLLSSLSPEISSLWQMRPEFQAITARAADPERLTAGSTAIQPGAQYGGATQDIERLRAQAFGTGPTASAQAQLEAQRLGEQQQRNLVGQQAATGAAQAQSQLAQAGGLSGGARERLARQTGLGQLQASQQVGSQGAAQRAGIIAQDEAQRAALQQQMPGMQLGAAQFQTGLEQSNRQALMQQQQANQAAQQQVNLANLGIDVGSQEAANQFGMSKWQQLGGLLGGEQEAQALASSGGSGGGGGIGSKLAAAAINPFASIGGTIAGWF